MRARTRQVAPRANCWRILVVLFALLGLCEPAFAGALAPGDMPVLAPDQGLLLIEVDTNLTLNHVQVSPVGRHTGPALNLMRPGQTAGLYVVQAGDYRWDRIDTSLFTRYDFENKPEYRFHVEPGKITYAGDLLFRPTGLYWAQLQIRNRSLRAMDWLDATHPTLARTLPFVYSGLYEDPFPAFYRAANSHPQARKADEVAPPPAPRILPVSPREWWRGDRITRVALNPAGDLLAEGIQLDDTHWAIDLVDLRAGTAMRLVDSPAEIRSLQWSGDRNLLGGMAKTEGDEVVTVFHIRDEAGGTRSYDGVRIDPRGNVLATIPGDPDHILYVARGLVHNIDIHSRASINSASVANRNNSLADSVVGDVAWWPDGQGRLRMVLTRHDDSTQLLYGPGDGSFHFLLKLDADTAFEAQGVSFDGDAIYGTTDEGRGQRDLVVFDPIQQKVTRTLFSKPGVDVDSVVYDRRQTPIGVRYFQQGRRVTEYFDAGSAAMAALLQKAFPGRTVDILDRSDDGRQLILQVEASDQVPLLYHLDVAEGQASLLDSQRPWLEHVALAPTRLIQTTSADGFPVEAYLTLPAGDAPRPLLVLPHGGPVGVSDRLLFDPEVQFFASLGYGVLRVNFRGSDGYGRTFREAGYAAQGTRIEDDIDVAIQAAIASGAVDPQRMCIAGSSYGGYSALVSAIRWPDRFRCVVSISGVTDRLLGFSATDGAQTEEGRKLLERVFGDPRTQREAMMANSPVYHYRALQVPVMLVHGEEDMRVDYEHTRRLVRVLNLAGTHPVSLTFAEGDHSLGDLDQIDTTYRGVAGFLEDYLSAPATAAH